MAAEPGAQRLPVQRGPARDAGEGPRGAGGAPRPHLVPVGIDLHRLEAGARQQGVAVGGAERAALGGHTSRRSRGLLDDRLPERLVDPDRQPAGSRGPPAVVEQSDRPSGRRLTLCWSQKSGEALPSALRAKSSPSFWSPLPDRVHRWAPKSSANGSATNFTMASRANIDTMPLPQGSTHTALPWVQSPSALSGIGRWAHDSHAATTAWASASTTITPSRVAPLCAWLNRA